MSVNAFRKTVNPICDRGIQLHEMFVNALRLGRPDADRLERDWKQHKDTCPVCSGLKGAK